MLELCNDGENVNIIQKMWGWILDETLGNIPDLTEKEKTRKAAKKCQEQTEKLNIKY